MARESFSWGGFALRWLFGAVLVFASYNPEGYSFYHWVIENLPDITPLKAIAGIVLVIGYAIFIRATIRSLGAIGLTLAVAFFGTLIWLLVDQGWLSLDNQRVLSYVILIMLSAVLAIGLSWSFVRRRLTGQFDVDETDD
jgi:hypothetical protein